MPEEKDYYKILGVSRTATGSQIKEAYHNLALKYHPDRHPNNPLSGLAEDKFKGISEAYEVLGNQCKRSLYDSTLDQTSASNDDQAYDYSKMDSNKKAKHKITVIEWIGIIVGLLVITLIAITMYAEHREQFLIASVVLGIIGIGTLIIGLITRCPECHKLFVRRREYREEVDRSEGYMRVDRHCDHRDSNGKLISQETWQETVPAINVTYLTHYKCRNCYHEWDRYSTAQYEG